MFQVVNRCFQILQTRTEGSWRRSPDLVIQPGGVRGAVGQLRRARMRLIEAGERAPYAALPRIQALARQRRRHRYR